MEQVWLVIAQQWQQQSLVEVFGLILAIAYVWMAANETVWCWPAGFASTTLYAYVYWDVTLIFQMLLNVYYMAMAVWGFLSWRQKGTEQIQITKMSRLLHVKIVLVGAGLSAFTFAVAQFWLAYDLLVLDIVLTVYSLLATYLTVTKKLENWLYWSVINLLSIVLLLKSALYLSIILMIIYIIIAIKGLYQWNETYNTRIDHA